MFSRYFLIFLVSLSLLPLKAFATTLVYIPFDELAYFADRIVEGRVSKIEPDIGESGQKRFTIVTLSEVAYLKGSGESELKLRFAGYYDPGSRKGTYIPGMPGFSIDERVILMLRPEAHINQYTLSPIIGWQQGKFSIHRDSDRELILDGTGHAISNIKSDYTLVKGKRIKSSEFAKYSDDAHLLGAPKKITELSDQALLPELFREKIKEIIQDHSKFSSTANPVKFNPNGSFKSVSAPE